MLIFLSLFANLSSQIIEFGREITTETTTTAIGAGSSHFCPKPPGLTYGNYQGDSRNPGAVINYYCNPGYKIIGSKTFLCLYSTPRINNVPIPGSKHVELKWLPDFTNTRCISPHDKIEPENEPTCSLSMTNQHFTVTNRQPEYPIGSAITHRCPIGSKLVGPQIQWCRDGLLGGKPYWSPAEETKCIEKGDSLKSFPALIHIEFSDRHFIITHVMVYTLLSEKTTTFQLPTYAVVMIYIAIPSLFLSIIGACQMPKRYRQLKSQSATPPDAFKQDDTENYDLLSLNVTGNEGLDALHSPSPATEPITTDLSVQLQNTGESAVTIKLWEDEPVVQAPPSYEEAMKHSGLPSFESSQKLN